MSCCAHCRATEEQFDERLAERDLKRYRKKGPDRPTREILAAIRATGGRQVSLLDVGGGVGALHHELLGEVADSAVHVEVSSAYLTAASAETERRGHDTRVDFVHGDFVDEAAELQPADVVTLDRVICCYADFERLVALSAAKARRLYVASYPRERWFVRLGNALENGMRRLRGNRFRTFVHPVARIEELIERAGLERVRRRTTLVWEIVAYRRGDGGEVA